MSWNWTRTPEDWRGRGEKGREGNGGNESRGETNLVALGVLLDRALVLGATDLSGKVLQGPADTLSVREALSYLLQLLILMLMLMLMPALLLPTAFLSCICWDSREVKDVRTMN